MAHSTFEIVPFTYREMHGEQALEDERRGGSGRSRPSGGRGRPRSGPLPRPTPRPTPRWPPRRRFLAAGAAFDEPPEPGAYPAPGTEYVRWVQSALNRVMGAGLAVDGVMSAATRSALRTFQGRHGLPTDGIAGPDTEEALRRAQRPAHGRPVRELSSARREEAESFAFEAIDLEGPANLPTLRAGSRGPAVADLQRRLAAAGYSPGTVDAIFGAQTDAAVRALQRARGLSVDGIAGSQTWGALLAGMPGAAPPPAPTPPPAPVPGVLPSSWSAGPVDAPPWRPAKRTHSTITCGSRAIPDGLAPQSVTRGWTVRTQAIADVIRGPLFGWRNVEGGATGGQTGHVSGSYHYCGRAIDAFAPGVAWDTRATGTGLAASWRLANWAAHNAPALNVSQVIFYDRIWTADNGGWRPYTNPNGTGNSLQHRDHVHISVY